MHAEEWRAVAGYEGSYEVSNHGRVRSLDRVVPWGRFTRALTGKLLHPSPDAYGYTCLNLSDATGSKRLWKTHILVATAFVPNVESKEQVNHKDHNRSNNFFSNLEWVTPLENTKHAQLAGRLAGVTNPNRGLVTDLATVLEIRRLFSEGATKPELTERFRLHRVTIHDICTNRSWRMPPEQSVSNAALVT